MITLIAEDDSTSRLLLQGMLRGYGTANVAINGQEAVDAVRSALDDNQPYDLICLDILMPEMDGQEALTKIRELEHSHGVAAGDEARVLMTSALSDKDNVLKAFYEQCDGYLVKPIDGEKLVEYLRDFGLIEPEVAAE